MHVRLTTIFRRFGLLDIAKNYANEYFFRKPNLIKVQERITNITLLDKAVNINYRNKAN